MTSLHATERELAFLLVDAGRKLNDAHDLHMKPLGLSRAKWRVVAYVSRTPGISQAELAASIECSRMAITSLLGRMEKQELIERRAAPGDRRVRTVFLTKTGKHHIELCLLFTGGFLSRGATHWGRYSNCG